MTKLTARSSKLLAYTKAQYNHMIFGEASRIANTSGEPAVVDYLLQFAHASAKERVRADLENHLTPKPERIEAHGRRGMQNKLWRREFPSRAAMLAWCEKNDATIEATRSLEPEALDDSIISGLAHHAERKNLR